MVYFSSDEQLRVNSCVQVIRTGIETIGLWYHLVTESFEGGADTINSSLYLQFGSYTIVALYRMHISAYISYDNGICICN
jgi:hypothetical protein